jgi:hypothetical protein
MRQASGAYRGALHVIAGVMALSTLLPIMVSPPKKLALAASAAEGATEDKESLRKVA